LSARHPLVAVDDQVRLRLRGGDHDDRRPLAAGRQQAPMTFRLMHPKVLQTPLKLVKFQPHPLRSLRHSNLHQFSSGIERRDRRSVAASVLESAS
jgi:hypothetical protein